MTKNRFVGSNQARAGAVVLGLVVLSLVLNGDAIPRYRFYALLVAGVLTWLCVVHSFPPLFRLWMRFAEGLQTVGVTAIFSACYLVLVPVFRLLLYRRDPLHLRRSKQESGWVTRAVVVDAASLERMG